MDRNSIIGLILIAAILIGFSIYNTPSKEEIALAQRRNDSIETISRLQAEKAKRNAVVKPAPIQTVLADSNLTDSVKSSLLKSQYGVFANSGLNKSQKITLENELVRVTLDSKGGRIANVNLKNYKTFDGKPLDLFTPEHSGFGINFNYQGRLYNTDSLMFSSTAASVSVKDKDSTSITMRLEAEANKYIEYVYSLKGNSYIVGFKINLVGFESIGQDPQLHWWMDTQHLEKSYTNQHAATTVYYKQKDEDVDHISDRSDEKEELTEPLKWVALKQQFFTAVLISDNDFPEGASVETKSYGDSSKFIKHLTADITLTKPNSANVSYPLSFYFGPNHYQTLKKYDIALEKQIPLGWGIFGWVNRFCVIPVFNFLDSFNINYGIIILILTILIKLVLFPLTYKAYLSTAKMRVLKPEMEEINKKHENDDPLKKQQAVMQLYRQAGVNPLGGCLPMLLQMPILIAMFNFFPSSIELRQEHFLWANDLSTYDSIYDLGFKIPFYGDHVSLFTLLMTVSTILYTRMNNQMTDNAQMAQMKWIMYLMPIIFLGVFNNYSAGLSYYYFLANMITFGQQYLIKAFVNEDAIHAKIQENKKKPANKGKSTFQQKLEEMAKKQQQIQAQKKKK